MLGLLTRRPVQTNRHPDHDFRDPIVLRGELCNFVRNPVDGVVWIDRKGRERAGQDAGGIADRQTDPTLTDVDRQNAHAPEAIIAAAQSLGLPRLPPTFRQPRCRERDQPKLPTEWNTASRSFRLWSSWRVAASARSRPI